MPPYRRQSRFWPNACLVAPAEQTAGDHLRLDLRRTLEDAEDARVAQHAADLVLGRVAVAAVDLERVVGVRPCDAGGQQLRHAGFDVATPVLILLARGEISELTDQHGF